jgi:HEAT repeats
VGAGARVTRLSGTSQTLEGRNDYLELRRARNAPETVAILNGRCSKVSNEFPALGVLGGGWWTSSNHAQAKIDISAALPALTIALQDPNSRTRGLAAQDLGDIGVLAAPAVPALVKLLASDDEGQRNSACIGLRGIGPSARDALPALRSALSDPSRDVRRFAELAIASIKGRLSQ